MATSASLLDVQARWGYSEILGEGPPASWYENGRDIVALRNKRRAKIPFNELSNDEKYNLAFQCACVRTNLMCYLVGTEPLNLVQINRATLGGFLVPPNVWKESQDRFHPFSHYITTYTDEAKDARRVIGQTDYQVPEDPIVVGRSYEYPVMIDGYHRAALFWKFGPSDGTIPAYIPSGMT